MSKEEGGEEGRSIQGKEGVLKKGGRERETERERERGSGRRKWTRPHLYKSSLLRNTCTEPYIHVSLNKSEILPCACPRARPIVVVLSHLLQILLVWARFKRYHPLFKVRLGH